MNCRVISQNPLPSLDFLGRHYGLLDQRQRQWWSSPQGQALLNKLCQRNHQSPSIASRLIHHLCKVGEQDFPYWSQLKPGKVVDLGAGSGGFCIEARKRGWAVKGLEQSPAGVQLASALGFKLIEADLASSEARDLIAEADNVVLNHVFEHVLEPGKFIKMLSETMSSGSRLILLIPNPDSIWRNVFGSRWYGWDPPVHVHHYSSRALQELLEGHGFQIRKLCSIRRSDSLATALNQAGIKVGRLRLLLRALMLPVMPLLALSGVGPELLCVAQAGPGRSANPS